MCVHHARPDRLTVTLLVTWLAAGVMLLASAWSPNWGATLVIPAAAAWAEALLGSSITVGAALALWTAAQPHVWLTRAWRLDELGMWLASGGWTAYALVAVWEQSAAALHWVTAAGMAAAGIARITDIRRTRTHVRDAVVRSVTDGGR